MFIFCKMNIIAKHLQMELKLPGKMIEILSVLCAIINKNRGSIIFRKYIDRRKGFYMRKRIYAVCLCFLLLFTGCGSKNDNEKKDSTEEGINGVDTEETTEETTVVTTEEKDTTEEDKWNVPINFTWNPHIYGDIMKELYGEDGEEDMYGLIDAVLAREESCYFDENNSEIIWNLGMIVQQVFPIFGILVSDFSFESGVIYFEYRYDMAQHEEIIKNFKDRIEDIICSSVMETDNQTMAALAIYHFFSSRIIYDYEAMDDPDADVTSYRALMEYEGICQSFAGAYTYLLLQCGIPAVNISSMNGDSAHEWTLVKLNGNYYHMDPTYEEGYGGGGLICFGMTNDVREFFDYPVGNFNVMNIWWGSDIQANDETFANLWNINGIDTIVRDDTGMTVQGVNYETGQSVNVLIHY